MLDGRGGHGNGGGDGLGRGSDGRAAAGVHRRDFGCLGRADHACGAEDFFGGSRGARVLRLWLLLGLGAAAGGPKVLCVWVEEKSIMWVRLSNCEWHVFGRYVCEHRFGHMGRRRRKQGEGRGKGGEGCQWSHHSEDKNNTKPF